MPGFMTADHFDSLNGQFNVDLGLGNVVTGSISFHGLSPSEKFVNLAIQKQRNNWKSFTDTVEKTYNSFAQLPVACPRVQGDCVLPAREHKEDDEYLVILPVKLRVLMLRNDHLMDSSVELASKGNSDSDGEEEVGGFIGIVIEAHLSVCAELMAERYANAELVPREIIAPLGH